MEANFAETFGGSLIKEKIIISRIVTLGDFRKFSRIEKIVCHKLDDQRHIDMYSPLKFGQSPDIIGRVFKIEIFFKSLCRNNIPEKINNLFALGRYFHFDHRIKEQIAPVFSRRRPHIVNGS